MMRRAVFAALANSDLPGPHSGNEPSDSDLLKRFALARDESAFEALVQRHGPMVQGVCRRILGDAHEAEDAFQAVFLVLVRKSASVRRPELLANWLYGVAFRIARKARIRAIRKEIRERRAGKMPTQEQFLDLEWAELKAVLDEELSQLPEKYRAPLVLCYLRGQTNAEAAAQLGWPPGSMSEWLARGRELLRKRLNRRGLTLSAGLLAILLLQKAASASISPLLVQSTVKAAVSYSAKGAATGTISATALDLASDSAQSALVGYLKTFAIALTIALAIVLTWPTMRGFLELSQWFSRAEASWGQSIPNGGAGGSVFANGKEDSAAGAGGAAPPPATHTGGRCHGG